MVIFSCLFSILKKEFMGGFVTFLKKGMLEKEGYYGTKKERKK